MDGITYTQEQVNDMLQREGDRRVTAALETAKTKWEEELKKKLEEERATITKEIEERSKLSAEELAKKELEERTRALAARESEITMKSNMLNAQSELTKAGIPKEKYDGIINMIVTNDEKTTTENVKNFIDVYNSTKTEIESAVRSELSKIPKPETNNGETVKTKEEFDKLSYAGKVQFKKDNPELYAKFIK